ncbi:MAG: hypothetical protein UH543_00530 [Bacteroidales bacterium]|nr:hypothetical protein [Bacteroidales bacterium]
MILFDDRLAGEIFCCLERIYEDKEDCYMCSFVNDYTFTLARIFKINEEVIRDCMEYDPNGDFKYNKIRIDGEGYVVEVDDVFELAGNPLGVLITESAEEAFKFALNRLRPDCNRYSIKCNNEEFLKFKEKYWEWDKEEKSMVKVRLTYVSGSEEEQEVLDVLKEKFNVLKVSKEYPGRNDSKYSNIYVDVEVNKK